MVLVGSEYVVQFRFVRIQHLTTRSILGHPGVIHWATHLASLSCQVLSRRGLILGFLRYSFLHGYLTTPRERTCRSKQALPQGRYFYPLGLNRENPYGSYGVSTP